MTKSPEEQSRVRRKRTETTRIRKRPTLIESANIGGSKSALVGIDFSSRSSECGILKAMVVDEQTWK
jgi:hypothetical protein